MRISSLMVRSLALLVLVAGIISFPFGVSPLAAEVVCDEPVVASPEATPSAEPAIPEAGFPGDGGSLTVYAAASLIDAFAEMEARLEEAHPGLDIVIETAGSQTLVTQIDQGAPADVLATANASTMDQAIDLGLVEGDPLPFAGNRLVIVAPADNPAGVKSLVDLGGDDVVLVLANEDVPVGNYSRIAICDAVADGSVPDGFADAVNTNLVSEEVDVRSVLTKVQLGEADAGIVYASDAAASAIAGEELTIVEFPDTVPTSAEYPIAPVAGGNTELANAFVAYVMSDEGQAILEEYGFTAP